MPCDECFATSFLFKTGVMFVGAGVEVEIEVGIGVEIGVKTKAGIGVELRVADTVGTEIESGVVTGLAVLVGIGVLLKFIPAEKGVASAISDKLLKLFGVLLPLIDPNT